MYHVHVIPYLYRDLQCLCPYGLFDPMRAPSHCSVNAAINVCTGKDVHVQ